MFWLMFLIVALAWEKATIKKINKNANTKVKDLIGLECPQARVGILFVDVVFCSGYPLKTALHLSTVSP